MKMIHLISALTMLSAQEMCLAASDNSAQKTPNEVFTPETVLPSGVDSTTSTNPYTGESGPARKGTVAATLNNIALLNSLLSEQASPENQVKTDKVIEAITSLIPSLRFIGVFDLFTTEEWLSAKDQPGRVLVAVLYLQKYPQNITPAIKQLLMQIRGQTRIKTISESIDMALKESRS